MPERIRPAYIGHAAEIEYPIEAVVEMPLASFLDDEALGFADCKPGRGQQSYAAFMKKFPTTIPAC